MHRVARGESRAAAAAAERRAGDSLAAGRQNLRGRRIDPEGIGCVAHLIACSGTHRASTAAGRDLPAADRPLDNEHQEDYHDGRRVKRARTAKNANPAMTVLFLPFSPLESELPLAFWFP
jgi:hypothetical protein